MFMLRFLLAPLLLSLGFAVSAQAANISPEAKYQALLAAAKAGTGPVDWQALRFAYAERPNFKVIDPELDSVRKSMVAARQADNFPELLAQAKLVIDQDYVDGQAHLLAGVAYAVLKQNADADRERTIAVGLLKSIETGDGLSPATPFTVISVREEYELMAARKRRVTHQSLINQGGHAYDLLETVGQGGDTVKFYFLIDRVLAAENAMIQQKK